MNATIQIIVRCLSDVHSWCARRRARGVKIVPDRTDLHISRPPSAKVARINMHARAERDEFLPLHALVARIWAPKVHITHVHANASALPSGRPGRRPGSTGSAQHISRSGREEEEYIFPDKFQIGESGRGAEGEREEILFEALKRSRIIGDGSGRCILCSFTADRQGRRIVNGDHRWRETEGKIRLTFAVFLDARYRCSCRHGHFPSAWVPCPVVGMHCTPATSHRKETRSLPES